MKTEAEMTIRSLENSCGLTLGSQLCFRRSPHWQYREDAVPLTSVTGSRKTTDSATYPRTGTSCIITSKPGPKTRIILKHGKCVRSSSKAWPSLIQRLISSKHILLEFNIENALGKVNFSKVFCRHTLCILKTEKL